MKQIIRNQQFPEEGLSVVTEVDQDGNVQQREEWDKDLTEGQIKYRRGKLRAVLQAEETAAKRHGTISDRAAVSMIAPILCRIVHGEEITEDDKKAIKVLCEVLCGDEHEEA